MDNGLIPHVLKILALPSSLLLDSLAWIHDFLYQTHLHKCSAYHKIEHRLDLSFLPFTQLLLSHIKYHYIIGVCMVPIVIYLSFECESMVTML